MFSLIDVVHVLNKSKKSINWLNSKKWQAKMFPKKSFLSLKKETNFYWNICFTDVEVKSHADPLIQRNLLKHLKFNVILITAPFMDFAES